MTEFQPMRELPESPSYSDKDVLIIFGELFGGGYVNGLVEQAKKHGMKVIYSTVGRRDSSGELRPLNAEELAEKGTEVINIPLEAGFDLTPSKSGASPSDQLKGIKLKEWDKATLDWSQVEESMQAGAESFLARANAWAAEVAKEIPEGANVVFAHTMAGGVPRAKIMMPAMNRVFKGFGERYASSAEFWKSDLGQLCEKSFMAVTADTFKVLLDVTKDIRSKVNSSGGKVSYTAFGYHGTEILINGQYRWQSFAPYLQGWAKIKLEEYATEAFASDIKACVFNSPEILTNSSSVFSGIEIPLYTLVSALEKENQDGSLDQYLDKAKSHLRPEYTTEKLHQYLDEFFSHDTIKEWSDYKGWPQHNGPTQMEIIKSASTELLSWQQDEKNPMSTYLSELVFRACGIIMLAESAEPRKPVWWISHDAVAKALKQSN